jgi:hypothetical protein
MTFFGEGSQMSQRLHGVVKQPILELNIKDWHHLIAIAQEIG